MKLRLLIFTALLVALFLPMNALAQSAGTQQVRRRDFFVESEPGIQIFVREVLPEDEKVGGEPILLIHGGGPGGITSWDIAVEGYSVAAVFANAGHPTYVMNVRGWGRSTRPEAMSEPPGANPPLVCSEQAARDIGAVVEWISERQNGQKVVLLGWATGGQWANYYVAHSDGGNVSHLITLNSLYPVQAPWELREGSTGRTSAYRLVNEKDFLEAWTQSIPLQDKSRWRDPDVAEMYVRTGIASDPTSHLRRPPSTRVPLCYWPESIRLSRGVNLWNPAAIHVPVLAMRGERDFWSRPEDLAFVERAYVNAPRVKTVTIPGGTHYLFLDRPERGRRRFIQEVLSFLNNE